MGATIADWQRTADEWVSETGSGGGYWPPLSNLARVTEEVGELARLVNHLYGPKKKKNGEAEQELGIEICDAMFALVCLANSQGIDLDESWTRMMEKYKRRDRGRYSTEPTTQEATS
jgi:NTP pyrophosphatase (non-canonical NTP hydrolase)